MNEELSALSAYGSRGRRLGAYLVDQILMSLVQAAGLIAGGIVASILQRHDLDQEQLRHVASQGMVFGWFFWGTFGWFINYAVLQGLTGSTIGKRLFGLKVLRSDGTPLGMNLSLGRTLAYYASAIPFGLGFAAILWSEQFQCWHDVICGTIVVQRKPTVDAIVVPLETGPASAVVEESRAA